GGMDYFGKPFDPDILRMKLRVYAGFRSREKLLRRRELHVRESEELLRVGHKLAGLLEGLPVGVLIVDPEGRVCQTTDEVARLLATDPSRDYGALLGWWDSNGALIKAGDGPLARCLREGQAVAAAPVAVTCLDGSTRD